MKVSEHGLNNFLRKHAKTMLPIPLSQQTIQELGIKATRMNGYSLEDAAKIILGLDTEMGIEIKRTLLGDAALLFLHTLSVFSPFLLAFLSSISFSDTAQPTGADAIIIALLSLAYVKFTHLLLL